MALALCAGAAHASPGRLSGFVDLTAVQSELGDETQDTLRREGSLNWLHKPAPRLTLRGGLRAFRFDLGTDLEEDDWREEIVTTGQANWRHDNVTASFNARRRDALSRSRTGDLVTDTADAVVTAHRDDWPILSLGWGWQHIHDEVGATDRDTYDRRLDGSVTWNRDDVSGRYAVQLRRNDNVISGLRSERTEHVLRLQRSAGGGSDFRYDALYTLQHSGQTDELIGAGRVLESVPMAAGLYAEDASPELGALEPAPGLNDGELESPTSPEIDLGGALDDRNIGADLGFDRRSDAAYLYVDREPGDALVWSVWVSEDNLSWTEWDPTPEVLYNTGQGRFEITWRTAEHRYVKLVKGGLAATTRLLVTELDVFRELPPEFAGSERSRTLHVTTLRALWSPDEAWSFGADANFRDERSDDDYDDRRALDYGLRLGRETGGLFAHDLSWTESRQDGSVASQDLRDAAARYALRLRAGEELRGGLSVGRRWTWVDDRRDQAFTNLNLELRGRPLRTVEFRWSGGLSESDLLLAGERYRAAQSRLTADLQLRANLRVNLGAGYQQTRSRSDDRLRVRRNWLGGLDWRPTGALLLRGSVNEADDLLDTSVGSLLFDWRLSPKLSAGGQLSWSESGDTRRTERRSAQITYRYNPRSTLYARVSDIDFETAGGVRTTTWQQGVRMTF